MERIDKSYITRMEPRYIVYFVCRRNDGHGTWVSVYGKGYLRDNFDFWNAEENAYKTLSAATNRAQKELSLAQKSGMDVLKVSVVRWNLAWWTNEKGAERPSYMWKSREKIIYAKEAE